MHKLGSSWRTNSVKFIFDIAEYYKLKKPNERLNFAKKTLDSFISQNSSISNIYKATVTQQVQNNMEQYALIFPEHIDSLVSKQNYLGIIKYLNVLAAFTKKLPEADKYTNFLDFTSHFCLNKENDSNQIEFQVFYNFLFSQETFCDTFIQNLLMQPLILSFLHGKLTDDLPNYCKAICTKQLIESLIKTSTPELLPENFIPKLIKFTLEQSAPPQSIYTILIFLINLVYHISNKYKIKIKKLQDSKERHSSEINKLQQSNISLIENLFNTDIFPLLDNFMKSNENTESVITFYKILLQCTYNHETVINERILSHLIDFYKDISVELKLAILKFIYSLEELYKHPFICDCCKLSQRESFHLEQFCLIFVVENVDCFQIFSSIIEKIIQLKHPESIEKSLNKLISLIKPSSVNQDEIDGIIYDEIFKWLLKILQMEGLTTNIFHDDNFLNEFIINPANEVAIKFVKINSFIELLAFLINPKRNRHRKQKLIRKMIELSLYDPSIQRNLLSSLSTHFGPDVLRFYIKNMGKPEFNNIFDKFLPISNYDFRNLFISANCFQLVNKRINSTDFLISLLKLIFLIVNHTNDHFFDEWVITLPKDSPLFKLNPDSIKNFVVSSRKETAIYIPSLLPLLDNYKYEGDSPFNYYLIGRYSVPIYEKLSINHSYFPLLYSYYVVSPHHIHSYPEWKITPERQSPCYEFFPNSSFGYLQIPHINVTSISFNIKFSKVTNEPNCFMRFSGVPLIFKSGHIFVGNDFYVQVQPNKWIQITVRSKLFSRTEVSIDSAITSVNKNFSFECLGDNNGIAFVSYVIDKNVVINDLEYSAAAIKQHGSVAFVPIHSIYDFLHTFHNFLEMIEIYINNDETRNIQFILSLSRYVQSSMIEKFFSYVFAAILKNSSKLCPENETKPAWIPYLIDSIMSFHDKKIKTEIFNSILFDIETWKVIPIQQMKHFLNSFISKVDIEQICIELLFTKYNFLFSINVSYYFDTLTDSENETSLWEIFFSFWCAISGQLHMNNFDYETFIITEIVPLAFAAHIHALNFSCDANKFDFTTAIANNQLSQKMRYEIIQFIFNLENNCHSEFFDFSQLAELSLLEDIEISKEAFKRFRERHNYSSPHNITISTNTVAIFGKIGQKFSEEKETWLFFFEYLIKQKLETFPTPDKIVLEQPKILSIIYMMLISITRKIINLTHDITQKELVNSLNTIRQNVLSLLDSIYMSPKVDADQIFNPFSLCFIYDLMIGKTEFDIGDWSVVFNVPVIDSYLSQTGYANVFKKKLYQSIPLLETNWKKLYEDQFTNDDSNISDAYYQTIAPIFKNLILISLRDYHYFLNMLEILMAIDNVQFVQNGILHILKIVTNNDVHKRILKYTKFFVYYLSIIRSEVYTKDFTDKLFKNCISFGYFNLLSYFITYNDSFTFQLKSEYSGDYEFQPFLKLLEAYGLSFLKSDISSAAIVAVKLILKECRHELLNLYLELFSTFDNVEQESPMIRSRSFDSGAPVQAEFEREQNSDRKHTIDSQNENRKLISSKINDLKSALGPLFVQIICSTSTLNQILEDKKSLEDASIEFSSTYRSFKSNLINSLINYFFTSTPSSHLSNETLELSDTSLNDTTDSSILVSTESNLAIDENSTPSFESLKKIKLNTITRHDQFSYAVFALRQAARDLIHCYKLNIFYFNEFNRRLRKKEWDETDAFRKYSIFKSQKMENPKTETHENGIEIQRFGKSFRFSPFISPFSSYKTVIPSNFSLRTPNNDHSIETKQVDQSFLMYKPTQVYTIPITDEYPDYIFRFSSLYNYPENDLLPLIEKLSGNVEMMMNCILIRLDLRINSVIMKINHIYLILTDASCSFSSNNTNSHFIPKGEINLHNEITRDLCEDFLNGDFGPYLQFCGHFTLILSLNDILLSTSYISLNNHYSVYINSIKSGNFIIEFLPKQNYSPDNDLSGSVTSPYNTLMFPFPYTCCSNCKTGKNYLLTLNQVKKKWQANKISNFEYLMRLNRFTQRSICDLSSYPILPRILMDFNQPEFPINFSQQNENSKEYTSKTLYNEFADESLKPSSMPTISPSDNPLTGEYEKQQNKQNIPSEFSLESLIHENQCFDVYSPTCRNLAIPVQIAASQSPSDLEIYKKRFQTQSYFYAENISNPIFVAGLDIRLSPFCRALWFLNDGWDKGSRNFCSVQSSLSVTKKTFYEFPPDVFNGECFVNWNNFITQTGVSLNMKEYPSWNLIHSKSNSIDVPFRFAEMHRLLLEMPLTKHNLHSWIDLMFGVKQDSKDDLNVFGPLSYINHKTSEQQRNWILQCGRVPLKIFDKKHEQYHQRETKQKSKIDHSHLFIDDFGNEGENSSPDLRQTNDAYSNLSKQQLFALLSYQKKNTPIKYSYKYDIGRFKLLLFSTFDADECQRTSSYLNRVVLDNDFSIVICEQGVSVFKRQKDSQKDAIIKFDASSFNPTCTTSVSISHNKQYVAITSIDNTVTVARISYDQNSTPSRLIPLNVLNFGDGIHSRELTSMSAINSNQLVCATAFIDEVILWSISKSTVIWKISFRNYKSEFADKTIGAIEFDEISDYLFVAFGNSIFQLSLSGIVLRSISFDTKITSLVSMGFGFTIADRVLIAGFENGSVRIIGIKLDNSNDDQNEIEKLGEFEILLERRISHYPIDRIITHENLYNIEIFDRTARFPKHYPTDFKV